MAVDDALSDIGAALSGAAALQAVATQQEPSGIDAALADLAKSPEQLRAEIAAPQKEGGLLRNIGAGGNEFIAGAAGAPVDAMTWALNKAHDVLTSPPAGTPPWISNPLGGSESIKSAMGLVGADPRNVGANNWQEQAARRVGEGAVGMVAPYAAGRALIAQGVDAGLPGATARMLGGPASADAGILRTAAGAAGNAAIGGAAGGAGFGAESLLPEGSPYRPLANLGGQLVGGALVAGGMGAAKPAINYAANQASDIGAPLFEAGREGIVGQRLRAGATDPQATMESFATPSPELVPGSRPTAYQLSGDQGIGQLERGQRVLSAPPFLERAGEQNAARVAALGELAPESAAPSSVREYLAQELNRITQEGDANVAAARQNAQQAFEQAGGRLPREDLGTLMRDQMEAAKGATKQQESALWQAIDPEGKLTINGLPLRQDAARIESEIPKTAKQPEGEELAVLGFAKMAGEAMPFSDLTALRGRLLGAIRDERVNGQTPALRRMQQLRASMDKTIANASSPLEWTPAALARDPTLSAGAFDTAAANRYRAAADATRERAATFNNQTVGPALQERGNEYRLLASQVPERFIASPEGVQAFLAAGGDRSTLHDTLVGDLRRSATNPDGSLDLARYQSWLTRRQDALRALPELAPRLDNAAGAQASVDGFIAGARQQQQAFEQSAARHFLNAEPTQAVQAALGGKNPVGDMAQLNRLVAPDPDAKTGLKRAVADYMTQRLISSTESGTSGVNTLKSNAFQDFVKRNQPALASVFDPNELLSMQQIAADLNRSNRSVAGSKVPGGSDTAQNLSAAGLLKTAGSVLGQYGVNGLAGIAGYLLGGMHGAIEAGAGYTVAKTALDAIRRNGTVQAEQLMTDALLNPALARTLMLKATPANRPIVAQRLASQFGALGAEAATTAPKERRQQGVISRSIPTPFRPPPDYAVAYP